MTDVFFLTAVIKLRLFIISVQKINITIQVKQQMENYKSMDSQNKDNTRKLKEAKDDVESLDRRRQTLTTENQKLRELLHEAQIDRQKLKG